MENAKWNDIQISTASRIKGSEKYVNFYYTKGKTLNMYLSTSFVRDIKEDYLLLGWSPKNRAVILFFTNHIPHPGLIKLNKKGAGISIPVQSFLNTYNVDKKEAEGKFLLEYEKISDGKEGWIIYLDKHKNLI